MFQTYTIKVFHDKNPMHIALYARLQFCGLLGSSSPSQSTSKCGSVVPVVPTDVTFLERGIWWDTRDTWGVMASWSFWISASKVLTEILSSLELDDEGTVDWCPTEPSRCTGPGGASVCGIGLEACSVWMADKDIDYVLRGMLDTNSIDLCVGSYLTTTR